MDFKDIYVKNNNKQFIYDNDVYITFTTIPERLTNQKFDRFIKNITKFNFKIICFLSQYEEYHKTSISKEQFLKKIYDIKNKYKIEFIFVENHGPITKILHLISNKHKFKDTDIIIVIDDDMIYENLDYHVIGHEIYMCDCIGIDERFLIKSWNNNHSNMYEFNHSKTLFENKYKGLFYGWLSYSFRFYTIKYLNIFYQKLLEINPDIKYHDDLVISLYFYFINSNSIQLKLNTIKSKNSELFRNSVSLKHKINRKELEYEFYSKLKVKFKDEFIDKKFVQRQYIVKKKNYDFIYKHNIKTNYDYSISFYKYDKIIMTIGNIHNTINIKYFDNDIIINDISSDKVSIIVDDHKFISRNKTQNNKNTIYHNDNIDYLICSKYQNNKIKIINHIPDIS